MSTQNKSLLSKYRWSLQVRMTENKWREINAFVNLVDAKDQSKWYCAGTTRIYDNWVNSHIYYPPARPVP